MIKYALINRNLIFQKIYLIYIVYSVNRIFKIFLWNFGYDLRIPWSSFADPSLRNAGLEDSDSIVLIYFQEDLEDSDSKPYHPTQCNLFSWKLVRCLYSSTCSLYSETFSHNQIFITFDPDRFICGRLEYW